MDDSTPIELTRGELKDLMQEAVQDAFTRMGMDVLDPLEMQRDFQHLRDWRLAVTSVQSKGILTLMTLLITGIVAALWVGFKAAIHTP